MGKQVPERQRRTDVSRVCRGEGCAGWGVGTWSQLDSGPRSARNVRQPRGPSPGCLILPIVLGRTSRWAGKLIATSEKFKLCPPSCSALAVLKLAVSGQGQNPALTVDIRTHPACSASYLGKRIAFLLNFHYYIINSLNEDTSSYCVSTTEHKCLGTKSMCVWGVGRGGGGLLVSNEYNCSLFKKNITKQDIVDNETVHAARH